MKADSYETFDEVKSRLDEIVDAVSDESLSLDDALSLYEEAVGLGLRASDLLEEHIEAQRAEDEEIEASAEAGEGLAATDGGNEATGEETAMPDAHAAEEAQVGAAAHSEIEADAPHLA